MEWGILIVLWVLFGLFSSAVAESRGRSPVAWFFVGLTCGPFGFTVAMMPDVREERAALHREKRDAARAAEEKRRLKRERRSYEAVK